MANLTKHKTSNFTKAIHPRVTEANAKFLRKAAQKNEVSYSLLIDSMITAFRKKTVFTLDTKANKK